MRIQYASDLHLELWLKTTFDETLEPKADYLVLCGDIAKLDNPNLRAFLEYISERWKKIFWIPGNEEIWKTSNVANYSIYKMEELVSSYKNIYVLYKKTYLLEDNSEKLLLVGLSLWHKSRNDVKLQYHNNYYIRTIDTPVNEHIFNKEHKEQLTFLENILKEPKYPLLIASYYSPFTWYNEEDWIQEPKYAIIDRDVEKLITYPIIAWICGHNHLPIEYTRRYNLLTGYEGSVLFISNPRGKPKKNPYYRKEAVVKLAPNSLVGFEPHIPEEVPIWARV
jgi:predicted phosphodiesterase